MGEKLLVVSRVGLFLIKTKKKKTLFDCFFVPRKGSLKRFVRFAQFCISFAWVWESVQVSRVFRRMLSLCWLLLFQGSLNQFVDVLGVT